MRGYETIGKRIIQVNPPSGRVVVRTLYRGIFTKKYIANVDKMYRLISHSQEYGWHCTIKEITHHGN